MEKLHSYCDEFLVHAVNVEGTGTGVDEDLLKILAKESEIPITYAGGVHSFKDLKELADLGSNHLNVTIGSALDIFGGTMPYQKVLQEISDLNKKL